MAVLTEKNNDYPVDGMASPFFKQTHIWFNSAMPLDKFQSTSLHFGALDRVGHCSSPDLHRSSMPWVYIDGGCDMKYLGHLGTSVIFSE